MAPKTGATRGKKKTQVAKTKAMEKKKSCLTPGSRRKKQVSTSVKAGLHFPVGRIGRYLKEGQYSQRIGFGAPVYLAAVLKYLPTDVLELVGLAAKDSKKIRIIPRHVMLGVMHDEELSKLLVGVTIAHSGVLPSIHESLLGNGTAEDATKLPAKEAAKSPEKTAESP